MTARLVSVGDDFKFPPLVRNAFQADVNAAVQTGVTTGVASAMAAAPDVVAAIAAASSDTAVAPLVTGPSATRTALDNRYRTATIIQVDSAGTTDYTAQVQAALNTGADVIIAGPASGHGIARTTATLVMNVNALGQQLTTRDATIQPAFVGDCIQVTTKSTVTAAITGTLQPSSGDFSEVAAIRIGGTSAAYNPQQAAAPRCDIRNFKGSGIIWEHGSMIDFTGTYISDVTVDGFRGTANFDDNIHGLFVNTHVIRAARYGYAALYGGAYTDAWNNNYASSAHQFFNAKAFNCGTNYYIETNSCIGTVFSELSINPDTFTAKSRANDLNVIGTNAAFEGWVDAGSGNRLTGYANGDYRVNKTFRTRQLQVGSANFTAAISGQYTIPATTVPNAGSANLAAPGVTGLGTGRVVTSTIYSATASGIQVVPYIDASGNLHFQLFNLSGASKTVDGIISYVIWTFGA